MESEGRILEILHGRFSLNERISLLDSARVKSNLSGDGEDEVKNWNTDDGCRLIHLNSDPAISAAWTITFRPISRPE